MTRHVSAVDTVCFAAEWWSARITLSFPIMRISCNQPPSSDLFQTLEFLLPWNHIYLLPAIALGITLIQSTYSLKKQQSNGRLVNSNKQDFTRKKERINRQNDKKRKAMVGGEMLNRKTGTVSWTNKTKTITTTLYWHNTIWNETGRDRRNNASNTESPSP